MAQGRNFDAQSVLDFSIKLARDAGGIITKGRESLREDIAQNFDSIIKKNTSDLVTKTDQDTEDFVRAQIKQHYGDDARLIGEESYAAGDEAKIEGDDRLVFITDPIDGTTNFVANFPFFCISIAVWHNSQPLVGVVYAPLLDRLYYGRTGAGSFLVTPSSSSPRQLPLQKPLPLTELKHALIALEWGSDRSAETVNRKATTMERLASKDGNMVRGIRSIGSAALSCCFVAEGSLDLYHEVGCWAWDVGAGYTIINEAGGLTVGSKSDTLSKMNTNQLGVVTPDVLQGRKYCVVRGAPNAEEQKTLLKEFYEAMEEWDAA